MTIWPEKGLFSSIDRVSVTQFMRGSRKFCQEEGERGPNLTLFLVDEWREDANTTISEPSSARQ